MKKMALSFVKCITFFVGWAVAASLLPLPLSTPKSKIQKTPARK